MVLDLKGQSPVMEYSILTFIKIILILAALLILFLFFTGALEGAVDWIARAFQGGGSGGAGTGRGF